MSDAYLDLLHVVFRHIGSAGPAPPARRELQGEVPSIFFTGERVKFVFEVHIDAEEGTDMTEAIKQTLGVIAKELQQLRIDFPNTPFTVTVVDTKQLP